jgi:cell division septation protein DedD
MANDRKAGDAVREFRLEGVALLLVGGLLLVLLGGAFYVGRWYERQVNPPAGDGLALGADEDPLGNVAQIEPAADVDQAADFFDEAEGGQKELEPAREVARPSAESVPAEPPPATAAPAPAKSGGPFYVQVFAGRDRGAAEGLVGELQKKGFSVRLFSEREGRGALYKVRVGGYASREEAGEAAKQLQGQGYAGAWVTEVE